MKFAFLSKTAAFLRQDIWRIRLRDLSRVHCFFIKLLRTVLLAVRGFDEDKCKFRASALTFYSLLSVVPVLAMMFGVAKGFGLHETAERVLAEKMQEVKIKQEVIDKIIDFANSLLENVNSGFIAGIGVAFLLWAVIKLLSNIETAFNDIWGVKKPRSIGRKFSDYLSTVLICPILLVLSSTLTAYIASQLQGAPEKFTILKTVGPLVRIVVKLLPYCTVWLAFVFVFIFMPNTKVRFKSAIMAGIVAGTFFQLVQWIYVNFQIGAARYSAIYGSFAALPLFLLWLQISWLVVLFGAELSFAHQNSDTYEFEQDCLSVSHSFKRLLSLSVMHLLVTDFCSGAKPRTAESISHELEIPIRLVREVIFELLQASTISEVRQNSDKVPAYQPACDVNMLSLQYVIEKLDTFGSESIPVRSSDEIDRISGCLAEFGNTLQHCQANVLLRDI